MAKCYPIIVLAFLLLATNIFAATKTWVGPDGGSWTVGANWAPAGVPGFIDDVEISGFSGTILVDASGTTLIQSLNVINGSYVVFAGTKSTSQIGLNCIGCSAGVESGSQATFTGDAGSSNRSCSLLFFSSPIFTVDGTVIFGGGSSSNSSLLAGNANITINGSLIFEGSGNASLICTGGSTSVNGELIYTGGGNTSGATPSNLYVNNGATYEIAKNGGSVPNAGWGATSTLRISGMTTTTPSFVNGTTLGNFWWECMNQTAPAELNVNLTMNRVDIFSTGSSEVRIAAENGVNKDRTWTINGDYTQSGGVVNMSSGNQSIGKMNFKGSNFFASMTLTETSSSGKGVVEFGGTQPQIAYFGILSNTIDIVINTGDKVLLNTPLTINPGAKLTLTTGKVVTSASNLLTISNGATAEGGSVSSHILGPMRKAGNTDFVFPLGKATTYAPLAITAPSSPTDTFTAEYFHSPYSNTTDVSSPLVRVSTIEHWQLVRKSGSGPIKVTLHWQNGDASGINDLASLAVARFNGSSWVNLNGLTAGTQMTGSIQSDTTSAFNWFTFGAKSAGSNPLPIQLKNFTALPDRQAVHLQWATATEKNNAFFAIERSANGQVFEEIGRVSGAGNSVIELQYHFLDLAPLPGMNYYRLRQIDYDGQFSYSMVRTVDWKDYYDAQQVSLFPSPAKETLRVVLSQTINSAGEWQILNASGLLVLSGHWDTEVNEWEIPVAQLPGGAYFIQFKTGQKIWSKPFLKSGK